MIPKYPASDFSVFYTGIVLRAKAVPSADHVSRWEAWNHACVPICCVGRGRGEHFEHLLPYVASFPNFPDRQCLLDVCMLYYSYSCLPEISAFGP